MAGWKHLQDILDKESIMPELDPTIRKIADHYGFACTFDDILQKWIVRKDSSWMSNPSFYWSSEYDFGDFLDSVEEYFKEVAYSSCH